MLSKDGARLVLLLNEGAKPLEAELEKLELKPGRTAAAWGLPGRTDTPERMKAMVPPDDVALVYIR